MKKLRTILILTYSSFFICSLFLLSLSSIASDNPADSILPTEDSTAQVSLVYQLEIEGAIGVVTQEQINIAIEEAEDTNAELLLILLNTPGGFSNATRDICTDILNSAVPVCVMVYPSGAHSGSAGVYITYAAHFAAMAYTTNIGSAHPVSGGGELDSIMNEKVTNDAVAQIKSYAEKRNRNKEWAEKAVRESVNITDIEALEMHVINYRATGIEDLLDKLNGDTTEVKTGIKVMDLKHRKIQVIRPTTIQTLRKLITDPNIAFALLSIGGLGILLELYNPGAILPGVVGVISILLASYALQFLPINYTGLLLLLVAVILFIAEIKVVSHGILTVGGLAALFFGGIMLIDTGDPALRVSVSFLLPLVIGIGVILAGAMFIFIRDRKRQVAIGQESMTGKIAKVKSASMVYVDGALWQAECDEDLHAGEKVTVVQQQGMILKVKKQ